MTHSQTAPSYLVVLSGPSGVGKSTIAQAVIDRDPNLRRSISHTSRAKRPGEIDGSHYHFVSKDEFLSMRENGEFLETALIFGNYYGTSKAAVDISLGEGVDTILVIDWQGARNVRQIFPNSHSIYVLPPSITELKERLVDRREDPISVIGKRTEEARAEMTHCDEYDHVIINDLFDTTVEQIHIIMEAIREQRTINLNPSRAEIQSILDS